MVCDELTVPGDEFDLKILTLSTSAFEVAAAISPWTDLSVLARRVLAMMKKPS
jgi:hypothetical protein